MSLEKKTLHLVIKNGASTSKYSFDVDTIIAGRNPDSPLPLIHKDVSRKHIGIYIRGTDVVIEDLGSTNGTFVNGTKLIPYDEKVIKSSDDVWIGGLKAILMKVELEYFNLPKIEEVRAEQEFTDTLAFEVDPNKKPSTSPLQKNDVFQDKKSTFSVPTAPKAPVAVTEKPASRLPQNILKAPEDEKALSTRPDNFPTNSEDGIVKRSLNEEMYLAQLEEMKQKIILNTNNKAAEIVRAAKMEAELKAQEVYSHAQKARKEAEEFYIKRIHEAGRAADGLQKEAQKHSDELFQKTREQCETMRKNTTETLMVLQSNAQQDCEKMYQDMENQIRLAKAQRLEDFNLSLQQREQDYLAEIAKKNESKQQEFIAKIERKRLDHDKSLQEEQQEFELRIEQELHEHLDRIESESLAHETRIREESERHEFRIKHEADAHEYRIKQESSAHENRIQDESDRHEYRIKNESESHESRLSTELEEHNSRIANELELHNKRISTESSQLALRIAEDLKAHEERIRNESDALEARIKSELEEHQQQLAKEKADHQTAIQRSQDSWDYKLKTIENQHQEMLEKIAGTRAELEKQSLELEKKSLELDKTQTFLKATMTSYEQVSRDLAEIQAKKVEQSDKFSSEKAEYDQILNTKRRLKEELLELEKHVDREKLALKDKLENEKARFTKEEGDYASALRQQTLQQMKRVEQDLMTNIERRKATLAKELLLSIEKNSQVVNTQPESWRREREIIEKDLLKQFDHNLYGMNSESALPKNIDLKKQSRKTATKQITLGLTMGLALMLGGQYFYAKLYGPSPMQRAVASQQQARQKDLEVRKFNPPKSAEVRDNYVDAVIYTTSFVEGYDSDNFQKEFSLAVARQMLKLWKVDEDSSLQAVSISRALVKALEEKKEGIHPDYVQNGLTKMRELEKDARARITKVLGTNVRYEAFKRMEKEMFEAARAQNTF